MGATHFDEVSVSGALRSRKKVVSLTTATKTVTKAETGTEFRMNRAAGVAVTMPAIASGDDDGLTYRFLVETAFSGGNGAWTAGTGDLLDGQVENIDTDSSNALALYAPDGSDDLILTMNGTTTGGRKGSWVTFTAFGGKWFVEGRLYASGIVATPFS